MRVSIGNKKLTHKPITKQEKSRYFHDLKFRTVNVRTDDIKDIVGKGWTITYLFKDESFDRKDHYMPNNYVGTQFICVDVDRCEIPPDEFVGRIKYKPSVLHTTFSNLTESKEGKYCYHLLYFFDQVIWGEDSFHEVFAALTDDYKEYVDNKARDCHRVMFTSNSSLPNYVYEDYGVTYNAEEFGVYGYDDVQDLFGEAGKGNGWAKTGSHDKSTTSTCNLSRGTGSSRDENPLDLDEEFMNDLSSMDRQRFILKYADRYPYITQTPVDSSRYKNGYADLRNEMYYEVPSAQYRWDHEKNRPHIPKIKIGFRTTMLWLDANCFMKIIPDISNEYLVYLLITEVYKNFINSDGQMTNRFIMDKCKEVLEQRDRPYVEPIKKSFKLDKEYWSARGYENWLEVSRIVRREMRCEEFGSLYDFSRTVEANVREFRRYGIKTTKRTLLRWLHERGFPYETDRDLRDKLVIRFYEEDRNRSSREIERLCAGAGVKVSYRTIQKIVADRNAPSGKDPPP